IMSYMNGMMLTVATTCFALVLYIKKKLRDQAKRKVPTYQFLREKSQKRNIDPSAPLVFIDPDKKEPI
ncbi:phosphatidylcholine--retinol O-acyltransferase, partial [Acinetobacter baumannii]